MSFETPDPDFRHRVQKSFEQQKVMETLKATLQKIAPGEVEIVLPYQKELTQQNGFLHAGIATTVMDSACGYSAFTLMPADSSVLTVEFKINLCSPAIGDYFIAYGKVKKPGRTLMVTEGELYSFTEKKSGLALKIESKLVAVMQGTIMMLQNRADLK